MSEASVTCLIDAAQLQARIATLAAEMAKSLPAEFLVIGLLNGAVVFVADLIRALDAVGCRPELAFLRASSYGAGIRSSGTVTVTGQAELAVAGRDILLVDDIQDSGRTLTTVGQLLLDLGAARLWTCALLDKPSRRVVGRDPDFVGFTIEDRFVVGYGIDWNERYRHLPYVGCVD